MATRTTPRTDAHADAADAGFAAAQRRLFDAYGLDPRERTADLGDPDVALHVYEFGPRTDEAPLVFVHATAAFGGFFAPLLGHLADRRCIVFDRPGYGLSGHATDTETPLHETLVDSVLGVLDALALDTVDLVGHSMGAHAALLVARDHRDRVRRLVTLGAIPAFPGTSPPLQFRLLQVPVLGALLHRLSRTGEAGVLDLASVFGEREAIQDHPAFVRAIAAHEADPRTAATGRREFASIVSPFGWREATRLHLEDLRTVRVPTAVLWGEHDPLADPGAVAPAVAAIPRVRLEAVPAGHIPFLDHPERCAAVISGDP